MVTAYRQLGFHDHYASNVVGLSGAIASGVASGIASVSGSLPPGGAIGQALLKLSGTDYDVGWDDIEAMATAETDDTLVLMPDGAGGVGFFTHTVSPAAFVGARVYKSTDFSHNSSGNYLPITFNSERYDTSAFHNTGSNTERVVVPSDGYYHMGGCIAWDSNATGNRILGIRWWRADAGDNKFVVFEGNLPGGGRVQTVSADYFMSAGDWIELWAFQASGGTRTISAVPNASPELWIHLIGA